MVRKWPENGQEMARKWPRNGPEMAQKTATKPTLREKIFLIPVGSIRSSFFRLLIFCNFPLLLFYLACIAFFKKATDKLLYLSNIKFVKLSINSRMSTLIHIFSKDGLRLQKDVLSRLEMSVLAFRNNMKE